MQQERKPKGQTLEYKEGVWAIVRVGMGIARPERDQNARVSLNRGTQSKSCGTLGSSELCPPCRPLEKAVQEILYGILHGWKLGEL